jgi:glucosamine--fructose-6-phosphate aminotransferase (isomerizing)
VLIECLKRLDYRGYDSAGIGLIGEKLQIYKEVGEIPNLEKKVPQSTETLGIAHTRWATHGKVSKENAHPQVCNNNKIAVVHNGIIENFKTLREELQKKGYKFTSQTDSEVIAHLIDEAYHGNL